MANKELRELNGGVLKTTYDPLDVVMVQEVEGVAKPIELGTVLSDVNNNIDNLKIVGNFNYIAIGTNMLIDAGIRQSVPYNSQTYIKIFEKEVILPGTYTISALMGTDNVLNTFYIAVYIDGDFVGETFGTVMGTKTIGFYCLPGKKIQIMVKNSNASYSASYAVVKIVGTCVSDSIFKQNIGSSIIKISEDIPNLTTIQSVYNGSIVVNKYISYVKDGFIKSSAGVYGKFRIVTFSSVNKTMSITGISPNDNNAQITLTIVDIDGIETTITSNIYALT